MNGTFSKALSTFFFLFISVFFCQPWTLSWHGIEWQISFQRLQLHLFVILCTQQTLTSPLLHFQKKNLDCILVKQFSLSLCKSILYLVFRTILWKGKVISSFNILENPVNVFQTGQVAQNVFCVRFLSIIQLFTHSLSLTPLPYPCYSPPQYFHLYSSALSSRAVSHVGSV